jgi:ATP-binding cassette subfamily B protein
VEKADRMGAGFVQPDVEFRVALPALVRVFWSFGRPWRRGIVLYAASFVVAQGLHSLEPWAFGQAINALQRGDPLGTISGWLLGGVGLSLLFWAFHGPARVVERRIALKIQQAFRTHIYQELTRMPLAWHQDHHSGNTLNRLNKASTALYRFAEGGFQHIEAGVELVLALAFLMWISVPVGLVSLLAAVLIALLVVVFDRRIIPLYDSENRIDHQVGALLHDYVSNITTILTLRLGAMTHKSLVHCITSVWPVFRKETVLNEAKWCSLKVLKSVVQAGVLIGYVAAVVHSGEAVQIGLVVMVFRWQRSLSDVFNQVSFHYSELVRMNADVESITPLLEDIRRLAHAPCGARKARSWQRLEVSGLDFGYASDPERKSGLSDVSFSLARGQRVALLGGSGGGKSTLLNLMSGLYKADRVQLQVDDAVFSTLEPLQAITTLIPQDPEIFENTLRFNITLGLPASQEETDQIIRMAALEPVLADLPQGLETDVREKGLNLSVGQKQRLALARGLFAARHSSLVLMDEPTSSVDLPTEKGILTRVMAGLPEATLMVSLHRLHLLPLFDQVIMLDKGQVVAAGAVQALLSTQGPVRDLFQVGTAPNPHTPPLTPGSPA